MKTQFTFLFFLFSTTTIFCQATLSGSMIDKVKGEPLAFGEIRVYQENRLITGEITDIAGDYSLELKEGTYDIVFSYIGYNQVMISNVVLQDKKETYLDEALISGITMEFVIVVGDKLPDIEHGGCGSSWGFFYIKNEAEEEKRVFAEQNSFRLIYPNPASSYFTAGRPALDSEIRIFDLSGKLLRKLNKGKERIDISNLLPGTYLVEISDGKTTQTEKLIVVR